MRRALAVAALGCLVGLSILSAADRELFLEAEDRYSAEDYLLAIQRYDDLIQQYPQSEFVPDAQYRKAISLYRVGRYRSSLSLLRRVETRFRSTRFLGYVPFWKGANLYELHEYQEAVEELSRYLEGNPDEPEASQAYLYRALCSISVDDEAAARGDLRRIVGSNVSPEEHPYAATLLASLLVQAEAYQDVINLYERSDISRFDEEWRPRFVLYAAEAYFADGAHEEAEPLFRGLADDGPEVAAVAYRRLYDLVPRDQRQQLVQQAELSLGSQPKVLRDLWLRLGVESYKAGRLENAELYLRRHWNARGSRAEELPEERTDSILAAVYLSRALADQDRLEAAATPLDAALEWAGDDPLLLFHRALLDVDGRRWGAAAASLRGIVQNHPGFSQIDEARYQLAYAYYQLGRTEEAKATLETIDAGALEEAEYYWFRYLIARDQGDIEESLSHLATYRTLRPDDQRGTLAYLTLLHRNGYHDEVIREADRLLERGRADGVTDYVAALSLLEKKQFLSAARRFESVLARLEGPEVSPTLRGLEASTLYHYAWAHYRAGDYAPARDALEAFDRRIDEHPLKPRALYLLGRVAFAEGDVGAAEEALLSAVSHDGAEDALKAEATFVLGQLYNSQNRSREAISRFRSVATRWATVSPFADDALFEEAQIQAGAGRTAEAARLFLALFQRFPRSPLAEEALYRRGEIFLGRDEYSQARDAFFEYRRNYPAGRFVDGALYWGGVAALQRDEPTAALLLWERLVDDYPGSAFRGDALARSADLYEEQGDLRRALDSLSELQSSYPERGDDVEARRRSDELILRIGGLSAEEARLWVAIDNGGRAQTEAGREAILGLARYTLYEGAADSVSRGLVVDLLKETANRTGVAPSDAADALFFLGEFAYRDADLDEASRFYLQAAAEGEGDLSAQALYKAVEMKTLARRPAEARQIVERMERAIPNSPWTAEARDLIRSNGS